MTVQEWNDYKLRWEPEEYGGVSKLHVPAEQIWLPDIVLYNNADGNYEVTIMTKAIIHSDGTVVWNPPAIYKSSCQIDVQYFPFDRQMCVMKFGSWTYDGFQVDLKHILGDEENPVVPIGIDLSEFYLSVEWDIMSVPATRREKFYSCCDEPYPDITFNITLRRKTLFYTVNLIIPCVGISGLSVLVFYLPSDSGEKVSLCISILLSLTFFFLVLSEIIPSTSLAMPLLGKYLVFTMILVTLSVIVTIAVLNVHFRSPSTHRMRPWVRKVFIHKLPHLLLMRQPQYRIEPEDTKPPDNGPAPDNYGRRAASDDIIIHDAESSPPERKLPRNIEEAIKSAMFIAQHIDNQDDFESVDLKHILGDEENPVVPIGIDLSEFYLSVEWDIMSVPATRREKFYSCCDEPYPDITFNITLRRKTLFYTVNLIIPSPSTHRMRPWVRKVFIHKLPHLLLMRQPQYRIEPEDTKPPDNGPAPDNYGRRAASDDIIIHDAESSPPERKLPRNIEEAIKSAMFIAQHIDNQDDFESVKEDWKYVAMVLDRLFLFIFTTACIVGTAGIFLQAPSIYDTEKPIDVRLSKVAQIQDYLQDDI
ncbi:nAChRa1 [Cordylochernes scorpioides]|uniref:NAChRa1 n=1 Tax=Cordylochernes scorpioides TaxID=51811 RepID=A0ABY6LRU4_9ARAC|nr:nAChRa1 [Cordylochernes scorpioides]